MASDVDAELDAELASRSYTGVCRYVRTTPPEVVAAISRRVAEGNRSWAAFARVANKHGADVRSDHVEFHYNRSHGDDR